MSHTEVTGHVVYPIAQIKHRRVTLGFVLSEATSANRQIQPALPSESRTSVFPHLPRVASLCHLLPFPGPSLHTALHTTAGRSFFSLQNELLKPCLSAAQNPSNFPFRSEDNPHSLPKPMKPHVTRPSLICSRATCTLPFCSLDASLLPQGL